MKKILLALLLICMFGGLSFAATLKQGDNIKDFALSKNVEGKYYSDNVSYVVYTGNTKGNQMYGSGSFVTAIYVDTTLTGKTFVVTDMPTSGPTTYDSSAFTISSSAWAEK